MRVFIGWRGLSATLWRIKELSFWNRKQRAHRLGQDDVTEIIGELRKIQKENRIDPITGKKIIPDGKLVRGDHDFGGALLYSATQQILQQSALFVIYNNVVPRLVADMINLVNPAFEARRRSALHDRSQTKQYATNQRTILAIFTSESDRATRRYFPLERRYSTLSNRYTEGLA